MYRVNFYREYFTRRRDARRRLAQTASVALLLAADAGLVLLLVVSGVLLGARARSMRAEIDRIGAKVAEISAPRPELDTARQLAEVRRTRIDWSPKLAGLSRTIGSSLILTGVRGQEAAGNKSARLEITGQARSGAADMDAVARFTDALRLDPAFHHDLTNVRLGNLGGDQSSRFQIVCEAPGDGS